MKTSLRNAAIVLSSILIVSILMAFNMSSNADQEVKEWKVPAEFDSMKNPTKSSAENITIGKSLYVKHCKSCHGKTGEGDGPKAEELDTYSGDFTTEEYQSQSDGSMFYKTKEGRDEMPSYKKKISEDEDIWLLVHYLRTLAQD